MTQTINYQPWLQALQNIAKHYRIEASEERIRLQLDWNQHGNLEELINVMAKQIGLSVRKNKYDVNLLNPWRLPVMIEFNSGEVGVVERIDADGNASVQLSGDEGLSQVFPNYACFNDGEYLSAGYRAVFHECL